MTTLGQSGLVFQSPPDTIADAASRLNSRIDSIQLRLNTLLNPDLSIEAIRSMIAKRVANKDSAKAVKQLDSITGRLGFKIDSIKSRRLSTGNYLQRLDSVTKLNPEMHVEKLHQNVDAQAETVNKEVNALERRINKPIETTANKINEKLALMNAEQKEAANLPVELNLKQTGLHGIDMKTDIRTSQTGIKLPNAGDYDVGKVEEQLPDEFEQWDELRDKAKEITHFPEQQVDKLKSIDELHKVQSKAGQVNTLVDKAQTYGEDARKIANGELGQVEEIPEAIESRVAKLEGVDELQKYDGEISKYGDMLQAGNDPEGMKAMAKEQVVRYAVDHFAGHQETLTAAIEKLSKLESQNPYSTNTAWPRRHMNPLRGKPFIERIVPGLAVQIQKGSDFMIDLNPMVTYLITPLLSTGAGWNERVVFVKWDQVDQESRIYGPRSYVNFALKKGWAVKVEVENMNVYVPELSGFGEGSRQWVWSVFAGIRKDYQFLRNISGNMQILYNLCDDHDNSPYLDRLNVRMGWDFPMKKSKH